MKIEEILNKRDSFKYQVLSKYKMQCNYFLGNGDRKEKYLDGGTVKNHIENMKKLWDSFDEKPEWLSREDILNYEDKMV